jgi:hypothetical protein
VLRKRKKNRRRIRDGTDRIEDRQEIRTDQDHADHARAKNHKKTEKISETKN